MSPDDVVADFPDGTTIYVMNSNYLEDIKKMINNRFEYIGVDSE